MKVVLKLAVAVFFLLTLATSSQAQQGGAVGSPGTETPATTPVQDSTITFQPSRPLVEQELKAPTAYRNSWGFTGSFSDFGLAGGAFLSHRFSPDFTGVFSLDIGTAKGSREFGFADEIKVNRIFVLPFMFSGQYRVYRHTLGESFRPYLTAGAGPVLVATTPGSVEFFSAFGQLGSKWVPGGFVGLGSNFGSDPKTTWGAAVRYYIIPYPGSIQSTSTQALSNMDGLFLTLSYGFNFD